MLQIGTVGTSSIMKVIQEAIKLTDGLNCKVIYSRNLERGRVFAESVGVSEVCDNYEEMIKSEDLDIIYIASPNVFHAKQAIAAMMQGKHVIVEKPAGITESEIEQMYAAAKENHVFFFEAITTLFMPNFQILKELVAALGEVSRAEIDFGRYSSKYDDYLNGKNPNIFNPEMKAGALNDMGIYCVHAAIDLFGRPVGVHYHPNPGENGIDLSGVLNLEYPDLDCRIECAKDHDIECKCRVEGEKGWVQSSGLLNEVGEVSARISTDTVGADMLLVDEHNYTNRMIFEQARFRDAILNQDEDFFEKMYRQSRDAAFVLEAAHK